MPGGELAPLSLVELTTARLRHEILSGVLAPGDRLVEEHLTSRFGTSRAPLREALRLLSEQGLVEYLPRRGARVARLSERDVDELFELRSMLERYAVERGLVRAGGAALDGLEAAIGAMDRAARRQQWYEQAEAHRQFHLSLVGLADHHQLSVLYEPVVLKLQLYMAANLRREAGAREGGEGARRHRRLFDAVATGTADEVLAELARHGERSFFR